MNELVYLPIELFETGVTALLKHKEYELAERLEKEVEIHKKAEEVDPRRTYFDMWLDESESKYIRGRYEYLGARESALLLTRLRQDLNLEHALNIINSEARNRNWKSKTNYLKDKIAREGKISAIKMVREDTGLGLKESKDIVDML